MSTPNVSDQRSKKIVVCCHCVLNQNAKLEGIAGRPGVIDEVVSVILSSGAGIIQMPCPEFIYEGIKRFDKSIEQYDCPAFQKICEKISMDIVDQIINYQQWGYKIPVILAIDGSPSCGYNLTQTAPEWKGLVAGMDWQKVRYKKSKGILFQNLTRILKDSDIKIPILGIPEIPELGKIELTVEKLSALLG
jgi:predicted secreted protein